MSQLETAARTALTQCLKVDEDDHLVVVTDHDREPIGTACYRVAHDHAGTVTRVTYPPGDRNSEEPPEVVATALANADAFLAPTSKSISHTEARTEACERGARGATLPGVTEEVFVEGMDADYDEIASISHQLHDRVTGSERVRVTSPSGTDITFEVAERDWHPDTGLTHSPGEFSNLPAGEVYISPSSADGVVVIDGTFRPHGRLDDGHTVRLEVENGQVTDVDDGEVARVLSEAADEADDPESVYNVAELGIGTNTGVDALHGHVLLDEKMAGTVHVAVGHDASIGGDVHAPIHSDGIITDPTVIVDGEEIELPE